MQKKIDGVRVIGLDADDTLWVNETYYREAEDAFAELLSHYETQNQIGQELFKLEMKNLPIYGYGVKGFVLSMVEMALVLSNNNVSNASIAKILQLGKDILNKPVELLNGVETVLETLAKNYKLVLVTKGDLLDQESKLERSNLAHYFHHVEILSDKKTANYSSLLQRLDIQAQEFLMIGNSLKSDILPLVALNAHAIHVPFHTTWLHEQVNEEDCKHYDYSTVNSLVEVLKFLD